MSTPPFSNRILKQVSLTAGRLLFSFLSESYCADLVLCCISIPPWIVPNYAIFSEFPDVRSVHFDSIFASCELVNLLTWCPSRYRVGRCVYGQITNKTRIHIYIWVLCMLWVTNRTSHVSSSGSSTSPSKHRVPDWSYLVTMVIAKYGCTHLHKR